MNEIYILVSKAEKKIAIQTRSNIQYHEWMLRTATEEEEKTAIQTRWNSLVLISDRNGLPYASDNERETPDGEDAVLKRMPSLEENWSL